MLVQIHRKGQHNGNLLAYQWSSGRLTRLHFESIGWMLQPDNTIEITIGSCDKVSPADQKPAVAG